MKSRGHINAMLEHFVFGDLPPCPKGKASKLWDIAAMLNDSLTLFRQGDAHPLKIIHGIACFIRIYRDPNSSKDGVPLDFIDNINTYWEKIIRLCNPNLSEKDLLTMVDDSSSIYNMDHIEMLLYHYMSDTLKETNQIHLALFSKSPLVSRYYDSILYALKDPNTRIDKLDSMPKPSEWPKNMVLVNFTIPEKEKAVIEAAMSSKKWKDCLPYISSIQMQSWTMMQPSVNMKDKMRWNIDYYDEARVAPAIIDILARLISRPGIATSLGDLDKLLINRSLFHKIDNSDESGKYGHILRQREGRNWFAIKFNHGRNVLCVVPGGKNEFNAILFEKSADDNIELMSFAQTQFSSGNFEDLFPFSLALFYPGTHNLGSYSPEPQAETIRAMIARAMLRKFEPDQSLIKQIRTVKTASATPSLFFSGPSPDSTGPSQDSKRDDDESFGFSHKRPKR